MRKQFLESYKYSYLRKGREVNVIDGGLVAFHSVIGDRDV